MNFTVKNAKSLRQALIKYVSAYPTSKEFTSTEVCESTKLEQKYVSAVLGEMRRAGQLVVKRLEPGKRGKMRQVFSVKTMQKKISKNVLNIEEFTSEQLLAELSRRVK